MIDGIIRHGGGGGGYGGGGESSTSGGGRRMDAVGFSDAVETSAIVFLIA